MKLTHLFLVMAIGSTALFAEGIDLKKSSLTWKGSKIVGGSYHEGPVQIKSAWLKNGKGEVVVDMTTIEDTTLKGKWNEKFIGHIKSNDFFDVSTHPTAKLTIEKIDKGYLHGKLTIKNTTMDVSFPVTKKGKTYMGELGFDRTKFGIIYNSGNYFKNLGDKVIADTVTVQFNIHTK